MISIEFLECIIYHEVLQWMFPLTQFHYVCKILCLFLLMELCNTTNMLNLLIWTSDIKSTA